MPLIIKKLFPLSFFGILFIVCMTTFYLGYKKGKNDSKGKYEMIRLCESYGDFFIFLKSQSLDSNNFFLPYADFYLDKNSIPLANYLSNEKNILLKNKIYFNNLVYTFCFHKRFGRIYSNKNFKLKFTHAQIDATIEKTISLWEKKGFTSPSDIAIKWKQIGDVGKNKKRDNNGLTNAIKKDR